MSPGSDRRLLLVHAHPDDESINNGATMAKYVAEGAAVTLVTCTLGEEGEVLVADLSHLAADKEDRLGEHRIGELSAAMAELGVTDHRFLGGAGRYRDSGMKWDEAGHAVPLDVVKRRHVLARRPSRGGRPPGRHRPRDPATGAGDLRRLRQLRPPRPHPGPPGGDVRRRPGGGPVLPARPRRALGDRQDLLDHHVGPVDARGHPAAARSRRHDLVRELGRGQPAARS